MEGTSLRLDAKVICDVSLFSALIIALRIVRIPIHVPGFGSMLWILILIIARGYNTHPLISTIIGSVSGLMVMFWGIDLPPGPHQFFKYLITGISMDLAYMIFMQLKLERLYKYLCLILGVIGSLSKLFGIYILAILLNIKIKLIKIMSISVISFHILWGCLAGLIGYNILIVINKIKMKA